MYGWIKIHRKILEWEWWDDPNVFRVFMYLLLSANHENKTWQGNVINSGQIIIGRKNLSKILKMSEQNVRTSLTKLKSTSEITIKTYSKFSLVTINNWSLYQDANQQINQQLTSNQPATNHNLRSKEYKNTLSKDKEASPRTNANAVKKLNLLPHEPPTMNERIDHSFPRTRLYGDEKINWLLDYVEHKLNRKLAGQERWNRIHAAHLAKKVGMGKAKDLIDSALVPENWWFDKITQFSTLYKNWDRVTQFSKENQKEVPKKAYIEGDLAIQDEQTGRWRVKTHNGIWVDYVGDVKKNLIWK